MALSFGLGLPPAPKKGGDPTLLWDEDFVNGVYRYNRVALDTNTMSNNTDIENNVSSVVPTKGALVRASFDTRIGVHKTEFVFDDNRAKTVAQHAIGFLQHQIDHARVFSNSRASCNPASPGVARPNPGQNGRIPASFVRRSDHPRTAAGVRRRTRPPCRSTSSGPGQHSSDIDTQG